MTRGFFKAAMGLLGLGMASASEAQVTTIDPSKLLFSMSTIAEELPALDHVSGEVGERDLVFHEDDWRQIEFFPRARFPEIQAMLTDLAAFERQHRVGIGWNAVFRRELGNQTVLPDAAYLSELLGGDLGAGPILSYSANTITGRVAHGFSLKLGGGVALYGFSDSHGVAVLGADVQSGADDMVLTRAFMKLSASNGLIVVDWRSKLILLELSPDGKVEVWRPAGE